MKTIFKWLLWGALLTGAVYGWHRFRRAQAEDQPPSAAQRVVDKATGRAAVRSFIEAKDKIQSIDQNQNRRHDLNTP